MARKKPAITGLPEGIVDDIFKAGARVVRRDVRKAIKVDNSARNVLRSGAPRNWGKATSRSVRARQKAGEHFAKKAGVRPLKPHPGNHEAWSKEWNRYWREVNKAGLSQALKEERAILNAKRAKAGRKPVAKNSGRISTRKIK